MNPEFGTGISHVSAGALYIAKAGDLQITRDFQIPARSMAEVGDALQVGSCLQTRLATRHHRAPKAHSE